MFVAPAACRVAMQQPRAARLQSIKEFFYIVRGEAGLTAFEVSQLISDETTEDPYGWHQLSLTKVFALFHSPADWIMLNSTGRGMIAYKYHPMFVVTVNGLDYCVLRHCHNRDPVVIRRVPLAPMVLNMHPQFSRYTNGDVVFVCKITGAFSGKDMCSFPQCNPFVFSGRCEEENVRALLGAWHSHLNGAENPIYSWHPSIAWQHNGLETIMD